MATLFEFLDSINVGTRIELNEDDPFKDYVPFQINNGLSQHMDTVMLANEMNKRPWISKDMQYAFLANVVTKKKRFGKWAKADSVANQEDIDMVAQHYQINKDKAVEYLKVLKPQDLLEIKNQNDRGGCNMPKKGKK
jgi:hypothetical protein